MSKDESAPPEQPALRDTELVSTRRSLAELLERLPTEPGVYLMKDNRGKMLYIGKAANLRSRVRQYFQPNTGDSRDFVPLLEGVVADIETVVTGNEKEALLLENNLIKRHQPRFNVKLTDDKNFLVLRLDPKAEWPRLEVGRRIHKDEAWYFGPYHSATSARETLRVVNRHFQLRTCTDHVLHNRRRPCLQYQIRRCPAPCVLSVPTEEYAEQIRDVRLFLEGKNEELLDRLRGRMQDASGRTEYERAATLRDQIRALESALEAQRIVSTDFVDQDILGFHREGLALDLVVMSMREGKMVGSRTFSFAEQEFPDAEILSSFVGLYYDLGASIPDEVLLPFPIADAALKSEWLSERRNHPRGKKTEVMVPQRGTRRELVELAHRNAAATFASRRNSQQDAELMLAKLQTRLRLPTLPRLIECYDISHVQGSETVASMVVFVDGRPEKSRYRTFKVQRVEGPDDFAAMYEVLSRRFRRAKEVEEESPWRLPNLIVVDGGKGQLGMALAAARDVGIDVRPGVGLPIVALAKEADPRPDSLPQPDVGVRQRSGEGIGRRPDRVFLPQAKDAIPIRPNSGEMFVLQQLRDEAHRFAVTFHRGQRRRRTLRSALSDVAGIGDVRRRALLRHFGSLKKIREATLEDLLAVPGVNRKTAEAVLARFGVRSDPAAAPPPAESAAGEASVDAEEDALESAFAEIDVE